jgi:Holliday junction resolvase RusA-like endonuclease
MLLLKNSNGRNEPKSNVHTFNSTTVKNYSRKVVAALSKRRRVIFADFSIRMSAKRAALS